MQTRKILIYQLNTQLPPKIAFDEENFKNFIHQKFKISTSENPSIRVEKRSIDARKKNVKVNVKANIYLQEEVPALISYQKDFPNVSNAQPVIIVGAGPAGMFGALRLIELGLKPIILERGKDVRARRRDLAKINKEHIVNPESNYCFGEGGAGTYSDGKLYTRSKKRGSIQKVLEVLVAHGATEKILYDSHPHIGTNKLPKIVQSLRESILEAGGEIHFDTKVTDFILKNGRMKGVITENGDKIEGLATILATGHSARDIFELLAKKEIYIEAKDFALGVRIEHAQSLIDQIQYHCETRSEYLPASSYALVQQIKYKNQEKGVFSFCMCPGGFIVPAATAPGEIVVNGMSPSRRNSRFANSGIVVSLNAQDWQKYTAKHKALAGLRLQQAIEQRAFVAGGKTQTAPAQRMLDFVENKLSSSLLDTSYQPGLLSVDMRTVLPKTISFSLQNAFRIFGKKMKGYLTNEAQIVGVESRTSSPVRIPRDKESLEHIEIKGLYPCGEGAGYAGGIMSAAIDGEKCAEQVALKYAK